MSNATRGMAGFVCALVLACAAMVPAAAATAPVLEAERCKAYVERFNADDPEPYKQAYPNERAWEFLRDNIPLLDCPDQELEQTYYFRWWTFRKHLQQTPEGWVITEFLPKVGWSGPYNTINCANGHHIREARWLRDQEYVEENIRFWLQKARHNNYSSWLCESVWTYCTTIGDYSLAKELLPELLKHYRQWETGRLDSGGMFWQNDGGDGMEGAIGGRGYRPTINAYMYANALAIAQIADLAGKKDLAEEYRSKAAAIKKLVQEKLWNPEHEFFEVRKAASAMGLFGWRVNDDAELTRRAKPSLSVNQDPSALNSGVNPPHSWDWKYPRVVFRAGTDEWIQYDFPSPVQLTSTQLFPMRGPFEFPDSFRVLYRENGAWKPVADLKGTFDKYDRWNSLSFTPVTSDGIRIELRTYGYDRGKLPLRDVRELLGYVPWYFNLPDPQYSVAWKQIADSQGFAAAWGLTTAEQRHPEFQLSYKRHECLWNGPVWPFATSQTLTALANLLNDYQQDVVDRRTYFDALRTYARSHQIKLPDGKVVPWIDENQNPLNGDWIARTRLEQILKERPKLVEKKGPVDRGKDYNHSTFCDLVINGLIGLRPRSDDVVVVNPLVPAGAWEWFCLDRVPYHGRMLTIVWDKTGQRYGKGKGLRVFADGVEIAASAELGRVEGRLAPKKGK